MNSWCDELFRSGKGQFGGVCYKTSISVVPALCAKRANIQPLLISYITLSKHHSWAWWKVRYFEGLLCFKKNKKIKTKACECDKLTSRQSVFDIFCKSGKFSLVVKKITTISQFPGIHLSNSLSQTMDGARGQIRVVNNMTKNHPLWTIIIYFMTVVFTSIM